MEDPTEKSPRKKRGRTAPQQSVAVSTVPKNEPSPSELFSVILRPPSRGSNDINADKKKKKMMMMPPPTLSNQGKK